MSKPVLILTMLMFSTTLLAQVPDSISFQGYLTYSNGVPIDSAGVVMSFRLYKEGTSIWVGSQAVNVVGGVFHVVLGSSAALDTVRFDRPIELGVTLSGSGVELSPRTPLTSSAYALGLRGIHAIWAESGIDYAGYNLVGGWEGNSVSGNAAGATIGGGGGKFQGGFQPNSVSSVFSTISGGVGNAASGERSTVGGGSHNQANSTGSTVAGGISNQSDADRSFVGGGGGNVADGPLSTIGGGFDNNAVGVYASVAGGSQNTSSGFASSIGGGISHQAGDSATVAGGRANVASANASSIAGGARNMAGNDYAVIGGGVSNVASGIASVVCGGMANTSSGGYSVSSGGFSNVTSGDSSAVVGGYSNAANGMVAFIGGGSNNEVSFAANHSVILGGSDNMVDAPTSVVGGGTLNIVGGPGASVVAGGINNSATGSGAVVAGGFQNGAHGPQSSVGGGIWNSATDNFAAVPGGLANKAKGYGSFASGIKSGAIHDGSFVWQDSTGSAAGGDTLKSSANNQFSARASGGFRFLTGASPDLTTGIGLPAGSGTWTALSSVSTKTNFSAVDARSYLNRVASLDLKEWSYKTEEGVTHVGPMAEDFYAAFGHGPTNEGISGVDADGVALAAIQGLYELIKELQAENARMREAMGRAGLE